MASKAQLLGFLHALGVNKNKVEYSAKGWSKCACPLAPFTHKSGTDSNPSFGISTYEGKLVYNCFSCGSGSLETLVGTLDFHLQRQPQKRGQIDIQEARRFLASADFSYVPLPDFEEALAEVEEVFPWDESALATYPKAFSVEASRNYLQKRGVTEQDALRFDIRYDTMRGEVAFPIRDVYGRLTGIRARSINPFINPKFKHYDHTYREINNSKLVFLNEPEIASMQPVVVVEGQFDMIKVSKVYPHVIANLTSGISHFKLKRLLQAEAVLLMLDNDDAGITKATKVQKYLYENNQQVAMVTVGERGQDPDDCTEEEIRGVLVDYIDEKLLTNS